jgi:predicted flavoprotein YhiN
MLACIQPKDDIAYTHTQHTPIQHKCIAPGSSLYNTQNDLLLHKVLRFYNENGGENMDLMLSVINGTTNISLRIMDWFVTNYSKKHYTVYNIVGNGNVSGSVTGAKRFKVYVDYKLKLRAYSKKRFDPFCRWERINVPHKNGTTYIETTLGQLNFFKWAIENEVIRYIEENYTAIETDMNIRNNTTRKIAKSHQTSAATVDGGEFVVSVVASGFVVASGSDAISDIASDHSVPSGSSVVSGSVVASKANVVPSKGGGTPKQRKKREELSSSATKSIKKEFVDIVITFN